MPKLRTFRMSGDEPRPTPSHARRTKPPAKELSRRKRAAIGSGGGRLPPALRKELDREGTARRVKTSDNGPRTTSTRAGKRTPKAGRYDAGVEQRDRREQRKSDTPETEPGARGVPATRITSSEPKAGRHRRRS